MDDQPLFGESKQSTNIIQWSVATVIALWVVYCVIIAIIYGLKGHWEHFVIAGLLLLTVAQLGMAFLFLKADTQEEGKFLWLCILSIVVIFATGATLNVYVWVDVAAGSNSGPSTPPAECTSCLSCNATGSIFIPSAQYCVAPGECPNGLWNITLGSCAGECSANNGSGNNFTALRTRRNEVPLRDLFDAYGTDSPIPQGYIVQQNQGSNDGGASVQSDPQQQGQQGDSTSSGGNNNNNNNNNLDPVDSQGSQQQELLAAGGP